MKKYFKSITKKFKSCLIVSFFILGLLFTLTYKHSDLVEGFDVNDKCPNLLVKKGKELHLVNTKKAMIPGVNPIKFNNLEEYAEFVKYQKYMNINCPILYYEETYDVQNNKGFRLQNDPLNKKGGLPSNISKKYNVTDTKNPLDKANHFSGVENENQNIGIKTKLDDIVLEATINPMDSAWKGDAATKASIKKGDFVGRTRNMNNPFEDQKILLSNN
jgi:hypothetical protein|uniref:Uncharacterized protein n=1 Tax=viral metagenome TaxID=1070528 RepID=A0A6C0FEP3_9ZZZZ|tara:strand:+ start:8421 stop:9071 length:651 start_codon:yes stop_codon:yes gene_type:complete